MDYLQIQEKDIFATSAPTKLWFSCVAKLRSKDKWKNWAI